MRERERKTERERDGERTENRELSQIDIERFWNLIFKRAQSLAEIGGRRRLDSKFRRKTNFPKPAEENRSRGSLVGQNAAIR